MTSRLVTFLGVIVALTGAIAAPIAQVNPAISFWLTIVGLGAAACGKALVTPDQFRRAGRAIKRNPKRSLSLLLVGCIFLSGCGKVGEKIVRWSDKASGTVERLRDGQLVSDEEAQQILPLIADVRSIGVEYAGIEKALDELKDKRDAGAEVQKAALREKLRAVGQRLLAAVGRLNEQGVLRIKNEKARKRLQQALAIGEIVLDIAT